jgi:hypothetical protein
MRWRRRFSRNSHGTSVPTLVFIDTNIFLDFYRVQGREGDLSVLDHIDAHHSSIITTAQVEMEFKKNRPGVILDSHKALKSPDWNGLRLPAYLARSKQSSGLDTGRKSVESQLKTLRARVENVLRTPTRYDPVYKVAQRLFRAREDIHLTRTKEERRRIRRLAWKRFILGYPPRKPTDTSIGDAINWEWIVHCANLKSADVVIVSRDSDYGVSFGGKPVLNDWLQHEFKERVGRRRQIQLTDRLTEGLKVAAIKVKRSEEKAEEELLQRIESTRRGNLGLGTATLPGLHGSGLGGLLGLFGDIKSTGDTDE